VYGEFKSEGETTANTVIHARSLDKNRGGQRAAGDVAHLQTHAGLQGEGPRQGAHPPEEAAARHPPVRHRPPCLTFIVKGMTLLQVTQCFPQNYTV